jgi:hypothetical protein
VTAGFATTLSDHIHRSNIGHQRRRLLRRRGLIYMNIRHALVAITLVQNIRQASQKIAHIPLDFPLKGSVYPDERQVFA